MSARAWPVLLVCLLLAGCGERNRSHAGGSESKQGFEVAGVTYKEGLGLKFLPETANSMGLKTETVDELSVPRSVEVRAMVIESGSPARLSATVSEADASWIETTPLQGVVSMSVNRTGMNATGTAELTFTMEKVAEERGVPVTLRLTSRKVEQITAVPAKAVLRCASGSFVYVRNGDHYMKTSVRTGAAFGDHVEITDGLYTGDIVVTEPAEQLWLIELRIVKGGAGCC